MAPDWQPIATAPTDGSRLLLFDPARGIQIGRYIKSETYQHDKLTWIREGWVTDALSIWPRPAPTHWLPLVAPPVAGEAAA